MFVADSMARDAYLLIEHHGSDTTGNRPGAAKQGVAKLVAVWLRTGMRAPK